MSDQAPETADTPDPTHDLLLSNGTTVAHYGAIPTLYTDGGLTFQVISATERPAQ